jgi:hypothetical protein
MLRRILTLTALTLTAIAQPLSAKESLGMFASWGAFRDADIKRCYAISKPRPSRLERDYEPYATVGTWPARDVRGQVHFRLSREMAEKPRITLSIGGRRFTLTGGGGDAWARDKAMDAAIVAAMRSAGSMTVSARDKRGRRFSNTYDLGGVATAMDAATVGCARIR